jgi:hypothetical protein
MKFLLFLVLILVVSAFLVLCIGSWCFQRNVTSDVRSLSLSSTAVGPGQMQSRWPELPEPVRRYLAFAIRENTPAIRTARLEHEGYFRTSPEQDWLMIEGKQYFTTATPGFVWNARVRPMPLFWISARDRLIEGRGNMLVILLSTFAIADASGPEIDQGSRLRWLAEAAWFPYAFVADEITWEPVDAHSARARLRCDGLPVSAVFEFDEEGRMTLLHAERYRDTANGKAVLTPWTGHYMEYRDFNGFKVPTSVEVAWDLESRLFTYARFHVTSLNYNINH